LVKREEDIPPWSLPMESVTIGLISCLSVVAVYFWIVRRHQRDCAQQQ
jgi:hypothetical protein